jgi:iron(III) transport system ATP-binding protein
MTPSIALQDAEVRYGSHAAVQGATLRVAPGELHVLLGRSGSGKTTLLRAMGGFERLSRGTLHLEGQLVDDAARVWTPPERRRLGVVFQDHALFPHLDVSENVRFGARHLDPAQVARWLERVGLAAYAKRPVAALSGGEQQRVALTRALATQPKIILFDEPFASLDRGLRHDLRRTTLALLRQEQASAVFVTHDPQEAFALGDRLSVIHQSRLLQTGSPQELYEAPASVEVATALGDAQWVEAREDEGAARAAWGCALPLRCAAPGATRAILRPERLRFAAQAPSDGGPWTSLGSARLLHRRYQGAHLELELEVAGTTLRAHARPTQDFPAQAQAWLEGSVALV